MRAFLQNRALVIVSGSRQLPAVVPVMIVFLLSSGLSGCAALTNPLKDSIQVSWVPEEFLAKPKEARQPIPMSLLSQGKTAEYRLAHGDTLGVWIEGVLSSPNQGPPVYTPTGRTVLGPALGYPIPVQEDGTISLPLVKPISVQGLTLNEADAAIRKTYIVTNKILQPDRERLIVTLLRRRTSHVIVMRDEAQNFDSPGSENSTVILTATQKRGNAHSIDLPVGENDVLNALGRTGGPPGLDAYNELIIEHKNRPAPDPDPDIEKADKAPPLSHQIIRIPLTLLPGEKPPFKPEDVILDDGDIIYVAARDVERFYTGGLLPPGEFVLPRNYDIDVVQAISFVRGPLVNGGFGGSGLTGQITARGIGGPSPSLVSVLRQTPDGGRLNIRVDLERAMCDPKESLLIKAGDIIILQETPAQAFVRYSAELLDNMTIFTFSVQRISPTSIVTGTGGVRLPGP